MVPWVSYEQTISDVVKVVEAVGAGIMVVGGLGAFAVFGLRVRRAKTVQGAYPGLRRDLGRCILLGLEVLIVADIVRTIVVDTDPRKRRRPGHHRRHPHPAQLRARGRDRRRLAVAAEASRLPGRHHLAGSLIRDSRLGPRPPSVRTVGADRARRDQRAATSHLTPGAPPSRRSARTASTTTGPSGRRSAYCGYFPASASIASGASAASSTRAVPSARTHQSCDQSSS